MDCRPPCRILFGLGPHSLSLVQRLHRACPQCLLLQKLVSLLHHIGRLDPVGRKHLRKEREELPVRTVLLRDALDQDRTGSRIWHFPEPLVAPRQEARLRGVDAMRHCDDNSPDHEGMDPIEPAIVLHIPNREIAQMIAPSNVATEEEVRGPHEEAQRDAYQQHNLHAEVAELEQHCMVEPCARRNLLIGGTERSFRPPEPALPNLLRHSWRSALHEVLGIHQRVPPTQPHEGGDEHREEQHVRAQRAPECFHVSLGILRDARGLGSRLRWRPLGLCPFEPPFLGRRCSSRDLTCASANGLCWHTWPGDLKPFLTEERCLIRGFGSRPLDTCLLHC
mmetsp:Transcript_289/g.684  ORF Transcript_289/g.684 Transcript_289/m.684 type:complete len:336 (+) Transcript_289:1355-2362(+)